MNQSTELAVTHSLAGISSEQIKVILTIAANLQQNYNRIGAPTTQNVRNPLPMRSLVLAVAPRSHKKAMCRDEFKTKLESIGYSVGYCNMVTSIRKFVKAGVLKCDRPNYNSGYARFWIAA